MQPSLLKIILLTGAGQGLLLALLLLTRRANRAANRALAVLLVLLAAHLILAGFDERSFFLRFPHLSHLTWLLPLLYGPLVVIFVRRLTRIAPSFRREELWYFLPFAVWLVVQLPYYLQPADAKRAYLADWEASLRDDFGPLNQLANFVHLFFFAAGIALYRRHLRRIRDFYSDLTRVRLRWLGDFLYFSLGVVLLGALAFHARKYGWPYLSHLYPYHFLGIVAAIYWMAYHALSQPELFAAEHDDPAPADTAPAPVPAEALPPEPSASRLDPALRDELAERLVALMEEERLFLNSELNLQDLTDRLGSNKQYVSEVLNTRLGKSFHDFVNDYRVAEFQRLAADPENRQLTLLALAFEAGFNSKATFNAVFKRKTGLTPSQFLRSMS